ncbi:hypothetical protein COV16_06140 [Candidatus Woesearchaeota archaeon CG10_big_fil_rev_8_21_14_0_10_34_8]|nr:MAG: hypothetical protein COV16_06140 [Candidatus Woesearchaeota archaeon CG10_big_fil_rev_8_21_14_0_10_34_8]
MQKKTLLITIIIIIILLAYPLYNLYALNNVEIQNFTIESIGMNNQLQFEVGGSLNVYNPNLISVTIKQIEYVGYIKGERVLSGTFQGNKIPAKESMPLQFTNTIEWVPDEETIHEIIAGEEVIMTIDVKADASYLNLFTVSGNKEIDINITKMVQPYVKQQIESITSKIADLLFS